VRQPNYYPKGKYLKRGVKPSIYYRATQVSFGLSLSQIKVGTPLWFLENRCEFSDRIPEPLWRKGKVVKRGADEDDLVEIEFMDADSGKGLHTLGITGGLRDLARFCIPREKEPKEPRAAPTTKGGRMRSGSPMRWSVHTPTSPPSAASSPRRGAHSGTSLALPRIGGSS